MSRFVGTETEYGIATPSNTMLSPIVTSTHAVVAFSLGERCASQARWDFSEESPLRDLRGFDLRRYRTVPVVDPHALSVANSVLINGGRFYVDHAHPEYSSPETSSAFEAMLYDAAGDVVMNRAVELVSENSQRKHSVLEHHDPCPPLKIYKNNVDGKGASYGSHENYLYDRATPFEEIASGLIPFFITRQVIIGAGRVGIGQHGEKSGFQISQRADYIEQEISLETTLNRGIINTRDEPHADSEHFGRLHVIIGDANMSQTSNFLKIGMTTLVLDAIEAGVDFSDLAVANPVAEVSAISHDLTLTHNIVLRDGRTLTALELLDEYRKRVSPQSDEDLDVLKEWSEILDLLYKGPFYAADRLDWCAKWQLISSFIKRGVPIDDPKIQLIDLQYADIDPTKSLYHVLVRKGRMRTLVSTEQINRAAWSPPKGSRAYLRGSLISRFPDNVVQASWDSITLQTSHDQATKIKMPVVQSLSAEAITAIDTASSVKEVATILSQWLPVTTISLT